MACFSAARGVESLHAPAAACGCLQHSGERGDVAKIERIIQKKLTRRQVAGAPAEVIVLPQRRWRSFGPGKGRRRAI